MKRNSGNALVELITTIGSILVTVWFFSSAEDWNYISSFLNDFITPTEEVIEYDPNK